LAERIGLSDHDLSILTNKRMHTFVINNDEDKNTLIDALKITDQKIKVYIQPLFPKATPNQYKYLFGVVYKRIADYAGYTNVWEVHRDHMLHYMVEYSPLPNGEWEFRRKSGSEFDTISIAMYIERVRADWTVDCGLYIEDANEIFVT